MGVEQSIIFCYDSYQRGLKLLQQRGEFSSAFFQGTHQCCHKFILFLNKAFDAIFSTFTQHNQAIPSPWGMPVFEVVDFENPSNFIMEYVTYKSVVTPDFSSARVDSYIDLCNLCKHLDHIQLAFPNANNDNESLLDQCPPEFDRSAFDSFTSCYQSPGARKLFQNAKSFQSKNVNK